MIIETPGDLYAGTNEETVNKYFSLLSTYVSGGTLGKTLHFFNDAMELQSC